MDFRAPKTLFFFIVTQQLFCELGVLDAGVQSLVLWRWKVVWFQSSTCRQPAIPSVTNENQVHLFTVGNCEASWCVLVRCLQNKIIKGHNDWMFFPLEKLNHLTENEPKAIFPGLGCGSLWNVMWKELELLFLILWSFGDNFLGFGLLRSPTNLQQPSCLWELGPVRWGWANLWHNTSTQLQNRGPIGSTNWANLVTL